MVKVIVKKAREVVSEFKVDGEKISKIEAGQKGKDIVLHTGPEKFPLVMFHGDKFYFALPPDFTDVNIVKKGHSYTLKDLMERGGAKESQGLIWGIVDTETLVILGVDNLEILIAGENVEIPSVGSKKEMENSKVEEKKSKIKQQHEKEPKKQESVPSTGMALAGVGGQVVNYFDFHSMRKKSLYVYSVILTVSLVASIVLMAVLGTMKLPPQKNDITAIPTRFAKLIVKNVPKPEKKKEVTKGTGEEEKKQSQEKQQKMEETTQKEKAATGNVNPKARRQAILKKVRHVGVLAILTSKGGQGVVQDVVSAANKIGDLDSVLSKMGGVETAKAGMDIAAIKKTRIGGAVASADIGSLGVGPGQQVSLGSKKIRRVRASINLGGGRISGALAGEVIRGVVKRNISGVKYCYEKELKRNPKLSGKIVVLFTIGTDGRVIRARIQSTTMHNENVESCILRMVRRWRFPRPEKGSVTVSYPFIFTPGS